jgi:hypothetical protein
MIIEQMVEIPANHRLTIEVPREVPAGRTILIFKPAAEAPAEQEKTGWRSLYGICKGADTLDAFLERKHADRERENAVLEHRLQERGLST